MRKPWGWGWDKIVRDIAVATHGNGELSRAVVGTIPRPVADVIDVTCLGYTRRGGRERGRGPARRDTAAELAAALECWVANGATDEVRENDDVFYVGTDGVENHIEVKTPKPNYDTLAAAKRRILRIHAARHPTKVRAFVGMPYNPNGYFGQYGWPTTPIYLDMTRDVLVGRDFWNHVGDSADTYHELLDCFLTVSATRRADIDRLLESVE